MLKIQIIGHIGQEAKINQVNDRKVINFSVAHSERFKDPQTGKKVEKTIWVNCGYWTDNTRLAEYLTKGRLVFIEGFPSANIFTNKDGQKMAGLNCRCTNIQLLGKNEKKEEGAHQPGTPEENTDEFEKFMNAPADKEVF
ncbi:MAG: single-stranded DNA-binding protein [Lentimicrobiaceae bacterium]|nr:single-stranded DNA-binding protein [Lentimicrobiaceae bacterium]